MTLQETVKAVRRLCAVIAHLETASAALYEVRNDSILTDGEVETLRHYRQRIEVLSERLRQVVDQYERTPEQPISEIRPETP
jgi:hypothetical protein